MRWYFFILGIIGYLAAFWGGVAWLAYNWLQ